MRFRGLEGSASLLIKQEIHFPDVSSHPWCWLSILVIEVFVVLLTPDVFQPEDKGDTTGFGK